MEEIYMSNYLEEQASKYRRRMVSAATGGIAATALSVPLSQPVMAMAAIGIAAVIVKRQYGQYAKTLAGIEGENILRTYLKERLNDRYTAIYNIPTRSGDIDCMLIGPSGIHVIEVKHLSGIVGCRDGKWIQTKAHTGKTSGIKSPSDQLARNIKWVRRFFGRHNVMPRIFGMIIFTHPKVILDVEDIKGIRVIRIDEMLPEEASRRAA